MSWKTQLIKVVIGILYKENKVLVAERPKHKPYSSYWEFPGGKIEANESSEAALHRELREELGIQVINSKKWFTHQHQYPDRTVLLHLYLVDHFLGEPSGKENQLLRWVTIEEMEALRILEGNVFILEQLKNSSLFRHDDCEHSKAG